MTESKSHKATKTKFKGKTCKTEVKLKSGKKLDVSCENKAVEIERNQKFDLAIKRLKESKKSELILCVPNWDMNKAVEKMKAQKVKGKVMNLSKTKTIQV
jgi:hypothetical protein